MPKGKPYPKIKLEEIATTTRRCYHCKENKFLTEFYPNKGNSSGFRYECKPCSYKLRRKELLSKPDYKSYIRNNNMKRKFGMTIEDYNKRLILQNYSCKICRSINTYSKHNVFHIDHNHQTGKVRGLLCNNCNLALGNFQDNIEILKAAIKYLEENNSPTSAGQLEFNFSN